MKKNKLILFFVILSPGIFSQVNFSWFPIRPSIQYNFKIDTSATPLSDVILIDSISPSQTVFYLNKIVKECDTCKNIFLLNDPNDSTYILNQQSPFLKQRFELLPGNSFYFKNSGSIVLKPLSGIGSSWLYDTLNNITASVFTKTLQPLFGNTDSVCKILLSTNDTIILSKNFGIIKFPFKTFTTHYYQLVGTEGLMNNGIKLKRFHDFFNFNPGDVLQFGFSDTDYNIFPPMFMVGHERWNILSVNAYPDSVCCVIKKTYYDSLKYGGSSPAITSYSAIINLTFRDSVTHLANYYPVQEILVSPYFIYNNSQNYIHAVKIGTGVNSRSTKSFGESCPNTFLSQGQTGAAVQTGFQNIFLAKNSIIVGRTLTEGLGFTSELYNAFDRIYQRCLIGYIKGQETSGIIYPDALGISIHSGNNPYLVFFNPADQQLIIEGPPATNLEIKVMNSAGQYIIQKTLSFFNSRNTTNTAQRPTGIYTAVITCGQSTTVKKVAVSGF
ncbi:MAG: T9SS type A sorting domain-containing protein [Bacteroidia bacterium]